MATLVHPHPLYFERWFEVSLDRKELDGRRALEIADLAKRHKYLSTQEFGGRLLALRWMLEGPAESLSKLAVIQRQSFLTQFPAYEKLSQHARSIRAELGQLPIVAEDSAALRKQTLKLAELDKANRDLELMLKVMAVRRMPSEIVFPPVRTTEETQKALPDKHALLTFFVGSRSTFGFLMTNDKFGYWPITSAVEVQKKLIAVLQGFGNYDENKVLHKVDLDNTAWQQPSQELFDLLTKDSKAGLPYGFTELAIVPDAGLWYVPFEALYVSSEGKTPKPLLEQLRIRYAPTMGLAVGDTRLRLDKGKALVSLGKLYPGDDDAVAETAFAEFSRAVPLSESIRVKAKLMSSPSLYAGLADRMITFADIVPSPNGPLGAAPMTGDKNSIGGTLGDWVRLPWQGPEQIALPGFHSAAENSLKKASPLDYGNDLFLTVTNLMASGARTILISRWRPGGRTAFDLVREFMQELPYVSATKAWQRAVALSMRSPIALDAEPRVRLESAESPPDARHPFFWAAYMIVDTGTEPAVSADDAAKEVLKIVPKKAEPAAPAKP
ncbi:MAG: CHAT domain-containing protein, partial [Planctomycetia bacterium]|nr:CHAT domain-containing protein [Planctomycetia bacterium]